MRSGQQGGNPPQTVLLNMVYGWPAFRPMNALSRLVAAGERRSGKTVPSGDQSSGAGP
jgi:hypothetical protein